MRWVFGLGLIFLTASATHLGMTVAIGSDLFSSRPDPLPSATQNFLWQAARGGHGLTASAIGFLDRRIQAHLFPALLPPVLLAALLLRWNAWRDAQLRNRVAVLLGLCVVMRLRSGFAGAEWYNVFAELPTTIMFLRLATAVEPQKAGRAVRALLGIFVLLGLYAYVSLGRGPLTFIGRFPSHPTAAGPIRWPPREFQEFHRVDSLANGIDPARSRPVFAFGLTGGWNYFLGRRNPSPLTEGSATSPFRVDSLIEEMRNMRPGPLVIDNKHTPWPAVSPKSSIFQWEPDPEPSPYARIDRARFDRLREGCTPAGRADTTQMITLYDCAMRALTPPGSSP